MARLPVASTPHTAGRVPKKVDPACCAASIRPACPAPCLSRRCERFVQPISVSLFFPSLAREKRPLDKPACCHFAHLTGNFIFIQMKAMNLIKITSVTNLNSFKVP